MVFWINIGIWSIFSGGSIFIIWSISVAGGQIHNLGRLVRERVGKWKWNCSGCPSHICNRSKKSHLRNRKQTYDRFFWRSTSNTRISNQRMTFWTQGCSSLIWGTYLCFYRCYQLSTQAVGGDCGRGWKSKLPTQTRSDELKPDQGIYVALGRISLEFLKATKNCSSSVQLCLVCSSLHLHTEAMEANIWKMKIQQWSFTQAIFDAESTFCYRSISKFVSNR